MKQEGRPHQPQTNQISGESREEEGHHCGVGEIQQHIGQQLYSHALEN